jgi:hypothetical protein
MEDLDLNLLLIQLGIIFLPGIIWERIDARYAAKVKPAAWEILVRAFLFGLAVYAVEFLLYGLLDQHFVAADFANASTKDVVTPAVAREIFWAVPVSFGLAVGWLYTGRYKLLSRFFQKIGATKKYGDEDIWDYMFNSSIPDVEYVHVRDFENGYLYAGWVNAFSESEKLRELILLDVIVYDLEGIEKYQVPRLYLARPPENAHIEFPYKATPAA